MADFRRDGRARDTLSIPLVRPFVMRAKGAPGCPRPDVSVTPDNRSCSTAVHRVIVAVDVEGSTRLTNPAKARLRWLVYDLLKEALRVSQIDELYCDPLVDRGDGVLVLIRPADHVPKTLLLDTFASALYRLLADHNILHANHRFRLRAAVHAGEVHFDKRGPFGEAVDVICRLLDTPELKSTLRNAIAPLALIVSGDMYRSTIKHGYQGIDRDSFVSLSRVQVAGEWHQGWVLMPCKHMRLAGPQSHWYSTGHQERRQQWFCA